MVFGWRFSLTTFLGDTLCKHQLAQPSSTIQPSTLETRRRATELFPHRCQGHPKVVGPPRYHDPLTVQLRKTVIHGPEAINPTKYRDLPEAAMALDKALFNIIITIAKGRDLALCIDLTGKNARYT